MTNNFNEHNYSIDDFIKNKKLLMFKFFIMIIQIIFLNFSFLKQYSNINKSILYDNVIRFEKLLDKTIKDFESFCWGYTGWNDLYTAIETKDMTWIKNNFSKDFFYFEGVFVIGILDDNENIVFSNDIFMKEYLNDYDYIINKVKSHPDKKILYTTYAKINEQIVLVNQQRIYKVNQLGEQVDCIGTMLIGKKVETYMMKQFQHIMGVDIQIYDNEFFSSNAPFSFFENIIDAEIDGYYTTQEKNNIFYQIKEYSKNNNEEIFKIQIRMFNPINIYISSFYVSFTIILSCSIIFYALTLVFLNDKLHKFKNKKEEPIDEKKKKMIKFIEEFDEYSIGKISKKEEE